MAALEPPDGHTLLAAVGWLELGCPAEAKTELAALSSAGRRHPDVLEVQWSIQAANRDWPAALECARALVEVEPQRPTGWLHQAYALRRVPEGGLKAAWDALRPLADQFPNEPTIAYNLSCYACQMNRMEEARAWLEQAWRRGNKVRIKVMALADEDLKPLWEEIRTW